MTLPTNRFNLALTSIFFLHFTQSITPLVFLVFDVEQLIRCHGSRGRGNYSNFLITVAAAAISRRRSLLILLLSASIRPEFSQFLRCNSL